MRAAECGSSLAIAASTFLRNSRVSISLDYDNLQEYQSRGADILSVAHRSEIYRMDARLSLSIIIEIERHRSGIKCSKRAIDRHHVPRGNSCHVAKLPFGSETKRAKRLNQPALDARPISASFRDPAGSLSRYHGRIPRVINAFGAADLKAFLAARSDKKPMVPGTSLLRRRP